MLLDLPEVPLPGWAAGIRLLGPVTREACSPGSTTGCGSPTIVVCVGAANALANPKRLLRSVPPALYEIGTALVVAVTVLPQFADSVRRVRAAQQLRAGETGRVRAAAPARGAGARGRPGAVAGAGRRHGRPRLRPRPAAPPRAAASTGALMLLGLVGICVGVYAVLDQTAPRVLACRCWRSACLLALAGFVGAGRRVRRTRYRADRWRPPEVAVAGCGRSAVGGGRLAGSRPPGPDRLPAHLAVVPAGQPARAASAVAGRRRRAAGPATATDRARWRG